VRYQGMDREWIVAAPAPAPEAESLAGALGVPVVAAGLLLRRGLSDADAARAFFEPRLASLRDPFGLPDMDRAVDRTWAAIDRGETILVHGDYDVDGMVGTAFLVRMLRALGADVTYFLPERTRDGYGIGKAGLEAARERSASLLLAVDCGITAVEETETARGAGIDVVILDHHQPPPVLPRAVAVVDALRADAVYPFTGLCGVGVAAKLIQGMAMRRKGSLDPVVYRDALQLVALGTIADVVPLLDENRAFVHHGLRSLARSEYPGVAALKRLARLTSGAVTTEQVAYQLAPRLNAAGRMGVPAVGVELLLADTPERGDFLAKELDRQNLLRREADQAVTQDAREQLLTVGTLPPFVCLWSDGWSAGVIGIAAARVAEEFHRPTLLIGMNGAIGRGSARSWGGLDVGGLFARAGDLLVAHGGHRQAAGLTVERTRLSELRERLVALAAAEDALLGPEPLDLDCELLPGELGPDLIGFLDRMAPFGAGSPEPLFLVKDLALTAAPKIVGNDHLKLTVSGPRGPMSAIGFGLGRHAKHLARGSRAMLAATPSPDDWKGGGAIQLKFRAVQVSP
jgi:single-stranded-DNA-specific exonuclease